MDDTNSDNSGSIKPKAWKRLRKGNARSEPIEEVCFDHHFVDDEDTTTVNLGSFAFKSMFWCGDNPDADELWWQAKIREEKLDEGAIFIFRRRIRRTTEGNGKKKRPFCGTTTQRSVPYNQIRPTNQLLDQRPSFVNHTGTTLDRESMSPDIL